MLDNLRISDSLGAPTERCLSKIAHWNEQIYYLVATFPAQGQVRIPVASENSDSCVSMV
jgi:hypothetical protein